MNQEQFEKAVGNTVVLLRRAWGAPAEPCRNQDAPITAPHLLWMLTQAPLFYAEGKIEKANRWLGYAQGVLAAFGTELDDLKRANMPDGETFDGERV